MSADNSNRLRGSGCASRWLKAAMLAVVGALLLAAVPPNAVAIEQGVFTGIVRDQANRPVKGALVTFTNRLLQRGTTVYSPADGRFRLPPLEAGTYDLHVRRVGYKDLNKMGLKLRDGTIRLDLKVEIETDPHELAWQLPASRWLPLVRARLSSDAERDQFTRQCVMCHQIGSWATRVQRSREDWVNIIDRMGRMGGNIAPHLRAELPDVFNAAFDDDNYVKSLTQPKFVPTPPPSAEAAKAVVTEWTIGVRDSILHDLALYPDGTVWVVDTANDLLFRLDPRTGQRSEWTVPAGDSPVALPGIFNARVGPHTDEVAPDGSIWITLIMGNKIARFDPRTEKWTVFAQKEGTGPHSLRLDQKGRIWYTLAISEGVGMLDPKTGDQRYFRTPPPQNITNAHPASVQSDVSSGIALAEGGDHPLTYGIDIAPNGGVWFSQLNAQRIGHIDPDTGEMTMIETPFTGPRRLRFDSKGNLWIPAFSANLLARYTPSSGQFKTWKLPSDGFDTPYALNVDHRTDTVWICGTSSDTIVSFDTRTERFTIYPLPTRVTFERGIQFDNQGGVWFSNSSTPAWQIEAGLASIIRLQPSASPLPE